MADEDGRIGDFIDLNTVGYASDGKKASYDCYRLHLSEAVLELSVEREPIIPQSLLVDLKNMSDTGKMADHFDRLIQKRASHSFNLLSWTHLKIDILCGFSSKYASTRCKKYEIILVDINLGNFQFNFDLNLLNEFMLLMNKTMNLLLLKQLEYVRPFFKPLKKSDIDALWRYRGNKLTEKDRGLLMDIKAEIIQDHFRLLPYLLLLKNYSGGFLYDVEKRINWSFRRSSLTYQLITGQSYLQIAEQEKKLFASEQKFINGVKEYFVKDANALKEFLEVKPEDTPLDVFLKNCREVNNYQKDLFYKFRICTSFELNLLNSVSKDPDDFLLNVIDPEEPDSCERRRDLEIKLSNICVEVTLPKGNFRCEVEAIVGPMSVQFQRNSNQGLDSSSQSILNNSYSRMYAMFKKRWPIQQNWIVKLHSDAVH